MGAVAFTLGFWTMSTLDLFAALLLLLQHKMSATKIPNATGIATPTAMATILASLNCVPDVVATSGRDDGVLRAVVTGPEMYVMARADAVLWICVIVPVFSPVRLPQDGYSPRPGKITVAGIAVPRSQKYCTDGPAGISDWQAP
jgi:hypothetical protein